MLDTLARSARRISAAALLASPLAALAMPGKGMPSGGPRPMPAMTGPAPDVKVKLELPLLDDETADVPVAKVGGELITMAELAQALAVTHAGADDGGKAGKKDVRAMMARLIDTRLIVAEARTMGIDELEDVKKALATFRINTLRAMVEERAVEDVRADAFELEQQYRAATIQYRIRSLLFEKADGADGAAAELRAGKPFDDVAKAALDAKQATGGEPGAPQPASKLLPEVAAALAGAEKGSVHVLAVPTGKAVLQLEEITYGEDLAIKAEIDERLLQGARRARLEEYFKALKKKYVKVDRTLLAGLDYHSEKRIVAYAKDPRVVARVQGDAPVTVAHLTEEIRKDFFHGYTTAIREKKINSKKEPKLDGLLLRLVFLREAAAQDLERSEDYRRRYAEFERSALFSTLVRQAILKDVNVMESEVRKHYDEHQADYTYPAMYRLDGLAFGNARDAQAALGKLQGGTDLKWLKTNAPGQLGAGERALEFGEAPISATGMPVTLARALSGAREGDRRLYSTDDGAQHYVVAVLAVAQPATQPYLEVREQIARKLHGEAVTAAIRDWARKLEQTYPVTLYVTAVGE